MSTAGHGGPTPPHDGTAATTAIASVPGFAVPGFQDAGGTGLVWLVAIALVLAGIAAWARTRRANRRRQAATAGDAGTVERLRVLDACSPAPMATLDAALLHTWANQAYLQWLGKAGDDVLGQPLPRLYGEAGEQALATARRTLAGRPHRADLAMGDGRIAEAWFEPRFGSEGPVDGVHVMLRDASWRTTLDQRLDALVEAFPDPCLVLDDAGAIVRCNTAAAMQFRAARDALRGRPFALLLAPTAARIVGNALDELLADGGARQFPRGRDLEARRVDGTTFPIALQLAPLRQDRARQALVTLQDLGPRIADERLREQSRTQAETAVAAIGTAVIMCDLQECITIFNPAAERMSGWRADDALGRELGAVLRFIDPATGMATPSSLRQALRGGKPMRPGERCLLRLDDERLVVEESATAVHDHFGQVSGGVLVLQDVTTSRAQAQTLVHQALHDPLTGLPNRVLLQDRLSQALAQVDRGYRGALLYLDLDRFKPINDSLGHPVGDRVLQEVATRLRDCVRQDDTVSRQGGDEFVLLLVRLADPRDAARVADKLIHAIEQPILVDGHELRVSASIGIALFPQDGRETRDLTRQADSALYHAKQGGRGRYSYVTDIIGASAEERMRTEHDLRIALANGDFLLDWQPQVRLPGGGVDGVEALVRWRNAAGTVIAPGDFIPVAEETGLVVEIDEWVLRQACLQAVRWQSDGLAPLVVSTNVSLARFDAERLLAHVTGVLTETGLAPRWLEIEFKGSQLFAHGTRGLALVGDLKALGVRVAADDFGSGQASLRELSSFAFDALKIDRDHVHGITGDAQSRAIIEAILAIGRVMGYEVVAKGVESESQLELLMALGCNHAQGRMFGQPVAADGIAPRLVRGSVTPPVVTAAPD